jgi:hypothetical protein
MFLLLRLFLGNLRFDFACIGANKTKRKKKRVNKSRALYLSLWKSLFGEALREWNCAIFKRFFVVYGASRINQRAGVMGMEEDMGNWWWCDG